MKEKLRLALAIVHLFDFIPEKSIINVEGLINELGDGYDYSLLNEILDQWEGWDYDSINNKVHKEYFKTN